LLILDEYIKIIFKNQGWNDQKVYIAGHNVRSIQYFRYKKALV